MTIVSLAVLVSMSVLLALFLKVISIQLIQMLAQSVVLVQMFVHLKQFIQNNAIKEKEMKRLGKFAEPFSCIIIVVGYFNKAKASLMRRIDSTMFSSLVA